MSSPKFSLICCAALFCSPILAGTRGQTPSQRSRMPHFSDGQALLADQHLLGPSQSVAVGDFNHDGLPDFVVGSESGLVLFLNKRVGGEHFFLRPSGDLIRPSTWIEQVVVADLNGDGMDDILAASPQRMYLLVNQPNGQFADASRGQGVDLSTLDHAQDLHLVDIESDGDLDLLIARFTHGSDLALLNDGQGNFDDQYSHAILADTPASHAHYTKRFHSGDFDGDGDADILAIRHVGFESFYIENTGGYRSRLSTDSMIPFMEAAPIQQAALADLDSNGTLDLYLAVDGDYGDRIYARLAPSPIFNHAQAMSPIQGAMLYSYRCLAGDFNQDSLPEIVTFSRIKSSAWNQSFRRTLLFLNSRQGDDLVPGLHVSVLPLTDLTRHDNAVVTGMVRIDANQDGLPDLLQSVDTGRSGGVSLLINEGFAK